jgi:hypothetical protein
MSHCYVEWQDVKALLDPPHQLPEACSIRIPIEKWIGFAQNAVKDKNGQPSLIATR